ncbi:hypothetical protein [Mesorhizobium silamurunense]|uniref:hypothetical protein n=1 Tax=Mesorhizobium silamurunense TaxID=499528 RepID=UPI0017872D43|nr:hypothetical protein [Mesorhizobium silamurunense]
MVIVGEQRDARLLGFEPSANRCSFLGPLRTSTQYKKAILGLFKRVASGMIPMDLKRGIDKAVEAVVAELKTNARKVTKNDEIAAFVADLLHRHSTSRHDWS